MKITPTTMSLMLKAAQAQPLVELGVKADSLEGKLTAGLTEMQSTGDYSWRRGTAIFHDWSWLYGVSDHSVRDALQRQRPSLREMIDFVMFPRLTTLGQYPFATLFLPKEWDKYGISKRVAMDLEDDIRRHNGVFGHALLIDTVNMIMTGQRDIPLSLLVSYMDNDVTDAGIVVKERFDREEVAKMSADEFYLRWCKTSNGMHDCIETHRLVFNINI